MANTGPIPGTEIRSTWSIAVEKLTGWPLAFVIVASMFLWTFADETQDILETLNARMKADTDAAVRTLRLIESGQYVPRAP